LGPEEIVSGTDAVKRSVLEQRQKVLMSVQKASDLKAAKASEPESLTELSFALGLVSMRLAAAAGSSQKLHHDVARVWPRDVR
jgi:hypothetical protein